MPYFSIFGTTPYTLDDISSVQIVSDITKRATISEEITNNLSLFYPYKVKDGETPEILADKFYNDSQLHWVILHCNEVHDAQFEWPLTVPDLVSYTDAKYGDRFCIHHYEDSNEVVITGNVYVESVNGFANVFANDVLINNTTIGTGVVMSKISNSNVIVNASVGGFQTGDVVKVLSNANVTVNVSATTAINCIPITAMVHEDRLNEERRDIKILKSQYLDAVVKEFESKMSG